MLRKYCVKKVQNHFFVRYIVFKGGMAAVFFLEIFFFLLY